MRAENVTVRLASERVSVVPPSGPVIGIRVVELVYAASGSGIWTNPAFAAGIQRSKPAKTIILEDLKRLVVIKTAAPKGRVDALFSQDCRNIVGYSSSSYMVGQQ